MFIWFGKGGKLIITKGGEGEDDSWEERKKRGERSINGIREKSVCVRHKQR